MISKKTFGMLFIFVSLVLSTNAFLSIPVKFDNLEKSILFNATFGTEECKIDTKADFFYCNNDIDFIRIGNHTFKKAYALVKLLTADNSYHLQNFTNDDIIGQINLGQPNPDFIKKDTNFIKMYFDSSDYFQLNCNFYSNEETTFFGQKIRGYSRQYIDFDVAESTIDTDTFEEMLVILKSKNYNITVKKIGFFSQYYLDTIEGLEPIKITILTEDMSPYILKIEPSVYTEKITNGVYKLLFQPYKQNFSFLLLWLSCKYSKHIFCRKSIRYQLLSSC
ncbi:transmembrane protein, putative (macronuclear) [Tetrahymena thermophila SB210]|uniref:Transmembrane protein, putative n=1 Tax=Tetrahymena thermophila (strain SB210) TaxID=312017 RepID=Q24C67_TETTS|nr:transmembrane protein, putative [Tetrahymena thermophila SB210]EAS05371.2 transmembrane protein, putative [Tetrahymena thermophila SB210]|eukprot:XP_001025616.2 transmembrane protein, putative [Tetrahymena thermophila SB210]